MFSAITRHSLRCRWKRHYSAVPQSFQVFDRQVKRLQKDRAASNAEESRTVDYLKDEIAARVADRLLVYYFFHYGFDLLIEKPIGYQPRFQYSS